MSENVILVEENEDKTITTIRLNRLDKKNALNFALLSGLGDALDKIAESKTRVVIITGGENTFSSGIDVKLLSGQDPSLQGSEMPNLKDPPIFRYWLETWLHPIYKKIMNLEKPVIAKINGYCYGGGFELALACDFRVALESAEFNMTEAKFGLIPDMGGTIRLTRLVGLMHTKDIILTGRKFDGIEAYRMGFLNAIGKDMEELDAKVKMYTDELIDCGPLAVGFGKKLITACYGKDINYGEELEGIFNSQLLQTKDFNSAGVARLMGKQVRWRGK